MKIVDKSQLKECYKCLGTGYTVGVGITRKQALAKKCASCNGTGKYNDEYYIITGNGIAIDSDFMGK